MKDRIHGVLSVLFVLSAFIVANVKLYWISTALGIGYSILLLISALIMIGVYCPKCPHLADNSCQHIFVGPIAGMIFKKKTPEKYTVGERLATNIPALITILLPQYWLFQDWRFLIAFWVLTVVYFLEVRFFVCTGCRNVYCEACPNKERPLNPSTTKTITGKTN
ncbi:MAG TPA: hypothetical protein VHY08_15810 [Bacillota bacterium]|nr:hypothetical protein [Bacillota bacterium]